MGRHSLVIAYLLWLPPLGWLGLHQCYLGRHYHGVVLFTTFAGFVVGWFRDLWRIPSYVRKANKEDEDEQRGCCSSSLCCCWPVLLFRCFRCLKGLFPAKDRGPPKENRGSQQEKSDLSGDLSDEDTTTARTKPRGRPTSDRGQREGANEQSIYLKVRQKLEKVIKENAGDLLNEIVNSSVHRIVRDHFAEQFTGITNPESKFELEESQKQIILNAVTQEAATILLEDKGYNWLSALDGSKAEEVRGKTGETLKSQRVQLCVKELVTKQQEEHLTVTDNQSNELPAPLEVKAQEFSDDETLKAKNKGSATQARKRPGKSNAKHSGQTTTVSSEGHDQLLKLQNIPKHYLGWRDNFERIVAAFLVSRYYRAVVSAAVSDYMETIWIIRLLLKLLPPLGMICGVYLVSNIGKPRRLTLSKLLLCGIIAEVLFLHVIAGLQILVCLACTIATVFFWKVEPTKQSNGSSHVTCLTVTLCAVIAMSLIWGSIIMNVTIEVDGDTVTVSEAFSNFYNSPGWTRMKESIWVTMTMSWEGNWDEAGETLLRMSDLSGTERALQVLGLPRDTNQAAIKARYKELAREWHPDKYQGADKEAASNKFIELQQAYTLLTKKLRG